MAKSQDIEIKRGNTLPIDVAVTDANGNPVNLTGATVYFTAKSVENDVVSDDSSAKISKTVTTHTAPTQGQTRITLTATDTNVNPGNYFYDITVKYAPVGGADAVVNTVVEGKIKIDGKPTNRSV